MTDQTRHGTLKPLKRLDPTWWRKVADGYDPQDGRASLVRLTTRDKVVGWLERLARNAKEQR